MAGAAAKVAVSLQGVSKRFASGTLALDGINLKLCEGEFVSLVGPSGCGKSTLLRLIAGLGQPTAGAIVWAQAQRNLGYVFQDATLMPWANALGNVMLPLKLKRMSRTEARDRARDMLSRVGLAGFENAFPRELSGGMKMRVSIARALVTQPTMLLMDEPFAALDEITRHKLNDDLVALWTKQRFTTVFVTHSVFESVYLAERVLTMAARPGRIFSEQRIGADFPRPDGFRTSPEYGQACRIASENLVRAMSA